VKLHAALSLICLGLAALPARAELVVYPEYPERIERDHAYAVTVTQQGGEPCRIPVYNHCEKSALTRRTRGGDVNRRFCEFAFSGAPVRVDITVCEDVQNYAVFPASRRLRHRFDSEKGVISVFLDKPTTFGIRLNDWDKTILSVFADAPEDSGGIPRKDDPGVLWVDGWLDAEAEDGTIQVAEPLREVYVAPGAVLNARLRVTAKGARIHGHGMILDPFSDIFRRDQTKNTRQGLLIVGGEGTVVEDVKLVDARTYNFCTWGNDIVLRNVKALSSMMCSDGITSGGRGLRVEGAWLYVGDNGLVVSDLRDSVYRDVAIGTSCNAIFPQNGNTDVTLENIDVFRADEGFVKNSYNGAVRRDAPGVAAGGKPGPQDRLEQSQSFVLRNLCAVDCTHFALFFVGGNMGTLPKTFAFENVSVPFCSGTDAWRDGGRTNGVAVRIFHDPAKWLVSDNFSITVRNLFVGGALADGFPPERVENGDRVSISVENDGLAPAVPVRQNRREVGWTCPWKVYVGDALQRDGRLVDRAKGERRLPPPYAGEELLAERAPARSAWQRSPSWMAKLEATAKEGGSRVYRVTKCDRGAGMMNVLTDAFLRHGNGTYRLSFRAAAKANAAVPLAAVFLSNEAEFVSRFEIPADGAWHDFETEIALNFDLAVTELVALHLRAGIPADELRFKNLSLKKVPAPRPPAAAEDGAGEAVRFSSVARP